MSVPLTSLSSWNVKSDILNTGDGKTNSEGSLASIRYSTYISEKPSLSTSISAIYSPGMMGPNSILEPVNSSLSHVKSGEIKQGAYLTSSQS